MNYMHFFKFLRLPPAQSKTKIYSYISNLLQFSTTTEEPQTLKFRNFQFVELFENPAFRPDGLKIYPTLVIRGTGLYELWKTGRYKSYPPQVLVE